MTQQQAHNIVMGAWRKSKRSGPNGGQSVEFQPCGSEDCVAVRCSKRPEPEGTVLHISKSAMREFFAAIKAGMFKGLTTAVEVKIADEIVVRGLADGGFVLFKTDNPEDAIEYDEAERVAFVGGTEDGDFDDMVAKTSTEALAVA